MWRHRVLPWRLPVRKFALYLTLSMKEVLLDLCKRSEPAVLKATFFVNVAQDKDLKFLE